MFTHLHVASSYSMHHGVSDPEQLVQTAAEHGAAALALTDRDGLYGAVKHVRACAKYGLAPILGVDLDLGEHGRVTVLARSGGGYADRRIREALAEKPELRDLAEAVRGSEQLDLLMTVIERLDGLPRHVSMHPCGVIISDASLLDRKPVEMSGIGLPMSQFDKHDMDPMGLSKFDILGVRMQSAMAHAVIEIARTTGKQIDLDAVPRDDPTVYEMLRTTESLGVFQVESPRQMQLLGKLQPEKFDDLTLEISLSAPVR